MSLSNAASFPPVPDRVPVSGVPKRKGRALHGPFDPVALMPGGTALAAFSAGSS